MIRSKVTSKGGGISSGTAVGVSVGAKVGARVGVGRGLAVAVGAGVGVGNGVGVGMAAMVADTAASIVFPNSAADWAADLVGGTVEIHAVDRSANAANALARVRNLRKRKNILRLTSLKQTSFPRITQQLLS